MRRKPTDPGLSTNCRSSWRRANSNFGLRYGWQCRRLYGKIQGRDAKTGTEIWMPAHPMLAGLLAEARVRARLGKKGNNIVPLLAPDRPIVVGLRGRPLTPAGLRTNFFKVIRQLVAAGKLAPGLTFHGSERQPRPCWPTRAAM